MFQLAEAIFNLLQDEFYLRNMKSINIAYDKGVANSIDKFRGVIGSLEMTSHHRTWDCKTYLVGENLDSSSRRPQSLGFLHLGPLGITCVLDANGYSAGSHVTYHPRFS
ncbi:hypothetical protein TNCV_2042091 [Trichonephila clavipes]|nr:hypothetical protein TNCV_2042091 [Trichonephila clavipes]